MRAAKIVYPLARRSEAVYALHGKSIPEPYDYLEDPKNPETVKFVADQANLFQQWITPHRELRENVFKSLSAMQNYPRKTNPSLRDGMYYFSYNKGLQNQNMLMRAKSLDLSKDTPEVFLDPNELAADGTSALSSTGWSRSERYFGYGVSDKGSDWSHLHVRDAKTGKDLPERLDWVKFSGLSWWNDDGFFYTRYPALKEGEEKGAETDASENAAIYFHQIGTEQAEDTLVFRYPEHPKHSLYAFLSDNHDYLLLYIMDGCEPAQIVWVAELPSSVDALKASASALQWKKIVPEFNGEHDYIGNENEIFYFLSSRNAPKRNIISLNIETGKREVVIAEKESVLNIAALVQNTIVLTYMEDVKEVMYTCPLEEPTKMTKLPLPIGTISSIFTKRRCDFVSFSFTSFTVACESYALDIHDPVGTLKAVYRNEVPGYNADEFETEQRFYTSVDGTRIPMFLVHRRGALTETTPVQLYAYGGFNISVQPTFSVSNIIFLKEFGGCFVVANIRGGGEYGTAWHDAGRREHKQNCFTDFIAALKYLHKEKIGSPATTAIRGGSNGGLLMGAVANQAPEEVSAVVAQVGVMDLFKFHKFTIGHAWTSDYGNPDVEKDFKVVEKYSPLHNVRSNCKYPAIMVLTGDHDDRVVPLHSLKYLATLQHTNPDPLKSGPFLGRIDIAAGHGAGKPTEKVLEEQADMHTFMAIATGAKWRG